MPNGDGNIGQVRAFKLDDRTDVWMYRQYAPVTTSTLPTGGGLVFVGTLDRKLLAFDDTTGEVLWKSPTLSNSIKSFPITYTANGKQYIAVVTNWSSGLGRLKLLTPDIALPAHNPDEVHVFAVRMISPAAHGASIARRTGYRPVSFPCEVRHGSYPPSPARRCRAWRSPPSRFLGAMEARAQVEPEFDDDPLRQRRMEHGPADRRIRSSATASTSATRTSSGTARSRKPSRHGLLLQPQRYVIPSEAEVEDMTRLYSILLQHCDVVMGFKLIPGGYPPWVGLTRAYAEVAYVYVTAKPGLRALADLPPGRPIAATGGTTAHVRLASYNLSLQPQQRWPVFPYGSDQMALEAVANGAADVGLVWAPSFRALQQENPAFASFRVIAPNPLPPTALGVGGLLLRQNTFLRAAVDQAIAALTADGSIPAIVARHETACRRQASMMPSFQGYDR